MLNRWLHAPRLHTPGPHGARKVSWLELFYDLIYVAALIQLGNALSDRVTWQGFLAFSGLLVPIWLAWTGFTFYSNRFIIDDFPHRLLVFAKMFSIGAVAISVRQVFDGSTVAFSLAYAATRLLLALMYGRVWWQLREARDMTRRYALGFGVGAALWALSALLPSPWVFLCWTLAALVDFNVPLNRQARALVGRYPPDVHHMSERYGLLILIVLGESFVKVLTGVTAQGATRHTALLCAFGLLITCSLWWIYFDDVAGSRIKIGRLRPFVWIYAHLPLTIATTAVGVAIKKAALSQAFDIGQPAYRWLLCGSLALTFLSVGLIDSVTARHHAELKDEARVNVRLASAATVVLLAVAGGHMPVWFFLGLVAALSAAQVLFDLSMAPETAERAEHEYSLFPAAPAAATTAPSAPPPAYPDTRASVRPGASRAGDALRLGVPNELKRDLYFHFMEGSWTQIFVAFAGIYVFGNIVFAALFLLEDNAVSNLRNDSFIDAFAFSVQTMATIGYGVLSPNTTYAHALVTLESFVGLGGVALATGLVFAKASSPSSSALFSDVVVVTRRNGKPMLNFRMGNARGNDVVEASVRVTLLRDELSPEGHKLRKLVDVELERDSTPLFALSWSVFHVIDEHSPFFGLDAATLAANNMLLIVTLTGHDTTYGQTTHARHFYYADNFRYGQRFVDVISRNLEGRTLIDYSKFHDTLPDAP